MDSVAFVLPAVALASLVSGSVALGYDPLLSGTYVFREGACTVAQGEGSSSDLSLPAPGSAPLWISPVAELTVDASSPDAVTLRYTSAMGSEIALAVSLGTAGEGTFERTASWLPGGAFSISDSAGGPGTASVARYVWSFQRDHDGNLAIEFRDRIDSSFFPRQLDAMHCVLQRK